MRWKNPGHEYDNIGYLLKDAKDVFLWGIGGYAEELLNLFTMLGDKIPWKIHLIDCNEEKQAKGYMGLQILSPQSFFDLKKSDYFVIACPEGQSGDEIQNILKQHDIPSNLIFSGSYFLYSYLPIYFIYNRNMVFFTSESILCSTVCNLNCRDCLNFTPYIKKHCTDDLKSLENDVDIFFNAVDLIYRFQITGGEPLLYSNLIPFIQYIHNNYGKKILRLEMVTNGTVKLSDELCHTLKECNAYVFLDDYRLSIPDSAETYSNVRKKLDESNIKYCDNFVENWICEYPPKDTKQLSTVELQSKFISCHNPWSTLREGKISACNYAGYAAKAEICMDEPNEYFDLNTYSTDQKKELIEFRTGYNQKGYVNFCKVCRGWTSINHEYTKPAIQAPRKK